RDPYPIEALPTCNHALSVCQKEKACSQLYENFKTHCKVRDGKCLMEDREACHEAWTNIRYSPMFGCICPNNHMKKRCDRVFTLVNHNPCIGTPRPRVHRDTDDEPVTAPHHTAPHRTRTRTAPAPHRTLTTLAQAPPQLGFTAPSMCFKEISKDTPSSFDGVESQLENPLVGIRGAKVKGPDQEHLSGYSKLFGSRATSHRSHPRTSKILPTKLNHTIRSTGSRFRPPQVYFLITHYALFGSHMDHKESIFMFCMQ
ncbi:hypothetical protein J6590_058895, partial [Homalodisca vitripennis]